MMNTRKTGKHGAAAARATDGESGRKHLTSREVERLIEAAKGSRNEARDRCLLLLMFRRSSG
jgi:integrase